MIRRVFSILFMALIIIVLTVACSPSKSNQQFVDEIFQVLKQTATTGIDNIDMELERIYQHIYDTKEKLLKLEQVMAPPLKWVEHQKSIDRGPGYWLTRVNIEELAKLQNDQFKIVKVEVYVERSGTLNQKFSSEIKVIDLETGNIDNGQNLESALKAEQKSLETQAEKKLEAREQLSSIMNSLLADGSKNWKVQKYADNIYKLSSPNFGWKDGLTTGIWTYNVDTGELSPADSNSAALNRLLSGLM